MSLLTRDELWLAAMIVSNRSVDLRNDIRDGKTNPTALQADTEYAERLEALAEKLWDNATEAPR